MHHPIPLRPSQTLFTLCIYLVAFHATHQATAQVPLGQFVDVKPVPGLPTEGVAIPRISNDGLALYFIRTTSGADIFRAERSNLNEPFGLPINIGSGINTVESTEAALTLTDDQLAGFFWGNDPSSDLRAIFSTTRASLDDEFANTHILGPDINAPGVASDFPFLTRDGHSLYFRRGRDDPSGGIYRSTRATTDDEFVTSKLVPELSSGPGAAREVSLSADELTVFLRTFDEEQNNFLIGTRSDRAEPFGSFVEIDSFGLGSNIRSAFPDRFIADPTISADWPSNGSKLYFRVHDPFQIYEATWVLDDRTGDFNEDGAVDGTDFLIWQRGESTSPLSREDLADWSQNYGIANPNALVEPVNLPEPASLSMTLLAAAMLAFCLRRGSETKIMC